MNQIEEDIKDIKDKYVKNDPYLAKNEYAFNYWVLTRLFNVEEEVIDENITEYHDDGIDCFVYFDELKELYIVQCKYYSDETPLNLQYIRNDFLVRPLSRLANGDYTRSEKLQEIFDKNKWDPDFKIHLYLYVTNNIKSQGVLSAFDNYRCTDDRINCYVDAKIYNLEDIQHSYFEDRKENANRFKANFYTKNKGTALHINRESYNLPNLIDAKYILTPVSVIYDIVKQAKEYHYPLFAENIREYLGNKGINSRIAKTLQDKNDRANFFYYNNGITVICDEITTEQSRKIEYGKCFVAHNPQIVNGCQTVNSIYEVLHKYPESAVEEEFIDTFVMVKLLVLDADNEQHIKLYNDIVRCNNSQNAIKDKDFAANQKLFLNLQKEFENHGFLLSVKQSDRNKFKKEKSFNQIRPLLNNFLELYDISLTKIEDIIVPLEKLLQVILAFSEDGYKAFTKKSQILKIDSSVNEKVTDYIKTSGLTIDNWIELYLLYVKAEQEKTQSFDGKTPIPFYLIGFLGYKFKDMSAVKRKNTFDFIFDNKNNLISIYNYYKNSTKFYKQAMKNQKDTEYNIMIKQPIDSEMLFQSLDQAKEFITSNEERTIVKDFIKKLN